MNPWAFKRKSITFGIFLLFVLLFVALPAYYFTRSSPKCTNLIQDGDETGVDCGGSCALLCKPETLPLITRGEARINRISSSSYTASVLVENPNLSGEVKRAKYNLSIYSSGVKDPVKVFNKETYIGPNSTFALFEGPFTLTGSGPFRAVFEWEDGLIWEKNVVSSALIGVESPNLLITATSSQRLEARLINRSTKSISNVEVVAILSDIDGNTVASSKTFVDFIEAGDSAPISFSWPEPFASVPVTTKILPHPLPDKSYIR